jgi:hypothetical protein
MTATPIAITIQITSFITRIEIPRTLHERQLGNFAIATVPKLLRRSSSKVVDGSRQQQQMRGTVLPRCNATCSVKRAPRDGV